MKVSDFVENETFITSQTSIFQVALEADSPFPYAARVGVIVSLFALVEDYVPHLLQRLTNLTEQDARSILGTFRAFSNRIDLLRSIYKSRGGKTVDAVVGAYFVGVLNDANRIRNKYAHAKYSIARSTMHVETFASDYNRTTETTVQKDAHFIIDIDRLKRIICELHAIIYRNEIPRSLHQQLLKLSQ